MTGTEVGVATLADGVVLHVSADGQVSIDAEGGRFTFDQVATVVALGGQAPQWWDRMQVARAWVTHCPHVDWWRVQRLVRLSGFERERQVTLTRTSAPEMHLLARDPDPAVRRKVAQQARGAHAAPLLDVLSLDSDPMVRSHVVCSDHTTAEQQVAALQCQQRDAPVSWFAMRKAARSRNVAVRLALASDPRPQARRLLLLEDERTPIPAEVAAVLARDEDPEIREDLARVPKVPEAVLEVLAADSYRPTRGAVARRDDCPQRLLVALAQDADPMVRAEAKHTLRRTLDTRA